MLRIGIAMHVDLVMQLDISLANTLLCNQQEAIMGVAVVEKVYKNGKIKISEYNYNVPLGYGTALLVNRLHETIIIFIKQIKQTVK